MAELHETLMGRKLIEGTLPDIAHQLERIANLLEKKDKFSQISTSFSLFVEAYPDDKELGKHIRSIYGK